MLKRNVQQKKPSATCARDLAPDCTSTACRLIHIINPSIANRARQTFFQLPRFMEQEAKRVKILCFDRTASLMSHVFDLSQFIQAVLQIVYLFLENGRRVSTYPGKEQHKVIVESPLCFR